MHTPTIIEEEDHRTSPNASDHDQIENDVLNFLKQTKSKMQQDQLMGKSSVHFDIPIPRKRATGTVVRTVRKDDPFTFDKPTFNPEAKLKMKGIIGGISNKKKLAQRRMSEFKQSVRVSGRKRQVQPIDFDKDLDIDEIIPKDMQLSQKLNHIMSEDGNSSA
jgi:hypothetical protein